MMKLLNILLFIFLTPLLVRGQEADTTLSDILNEGKFTGRTRTFFMGTANENDLSDYHALGVGFGLDYVSPEVKHFRLYVGGSFIFNVWSSDLTAIDPATNMPNRYEIGLFDIEDPSNKKEINRLEQLHLQYRVGKSFFRLGRMLLKTPFINPQDGRMSPTFEQGYWAEVNEIANTTIHAGWITHISPRSTSAWYKVENSFGLYPVGINPDGSRSGYLNQVNSSGIGLFGIQYKKKDWSLTGWNTYIQNISNTVWVQAEGVIKHKEHQYYSGLQFARQQASGDGGNIDPAKQYMTPGTYVNIFSSRIGWKKNNIDINVNGTYISDQGRFLMPREWGRDPFYTFLPRERNEGFGNVKAISTNFSYNFPGTRLSTALGIGQYNLPDVQNRRINKYAMPSYRQYNLDVRYPFKGFLKGADIQLLYVYKQGLGKDYENPKNILNKVNMSHVNLVLNYRFDHSHLQTLRKK